MGSAKSATILRSRGFGSSNVEGLSTERRQSRVSKTPPWRVFSRGSTMRGAEWLYTSVAD